MAKTPNKLDLDLAALTATEAFVQLLNQHDLADQAGVPILTIAGVADMRRLLRVNGAVPGRRSPSVALLRPEWLAHLGELWLGGQLLWHGSQASYPAMILAAFQTHGWAAGHIANPLSTDVGMSAGDLHDCRVNAVKNLNRHMPKGTLHFRLMDQGETVCWAYAPQTRRRRARRGT